MSRLNAAVTLFAGELESVTRNVTFAGSVNCAEPPITPLASNVKPPGSLPETIDQEYGSIPPDAVNAAEYGTPTIAVGSDVVVIVSVPAITVSESDACAVCTGELESVTETLNVTGPPASIGVPDTVPSVPNVIPDGSAPAEIFQVSAPVPPLACSAWTYGVPAVAFGRDVVVTVKLLPVTVKVTFTLAVSVVAVSVA